MKIALSAFFGIAPSVPPRYLPDGGAQIALNVEAFGRSLKPLSGLGSAVVTLAKTGPISTIYKFGQDTTSPAQHWFHWIGDIDVCRSQIAGDASEWTFYTGDGYPRATYNAIALGGGGQYPTASRRLGLPAPHAGVLATASGGDSATTPESRVYTYTWIASESGLTMESAPAPPSNAVDVYSGGSVTLDNFATPPSDGCVPTGRRIYRSVAGAYLFVKEVPTLTGAVVDTVASDNLNEALPSTLWAPPPDTLKGLVNLPNGMMAGFNGRDVLFCEPYRPYAWPSNYMQTVDYPVVGLGSMDTTLAVLTTGVPYLIQGSAPAAMTVVRSDVEQACVAKRSIVSMQGAVLYASPDGLVMLSPAGSKLVTQGVFERSDWQALNPSSIHAYGHDAKYIAFFTRSDGTKGGFVYDFARGQFVMHALEALGGFVDLRSDTLYLVNANRQVLAWNGGSVVAGTWRSKIFGMPQIVGFSCAQVEATSYAAPIPVRVFCDGAKILEKSVTSRAAFRLPAVQGRDWEIELGVPAEVFNVVLAQSMSEIASA